MKILITEKTLNIEEKVLIAQLEVAVGLEDIGGYLAVEEIRSQVVGHIAQRYLDLKMKEVLDKIDLDTIVKKVQMNVIQNLGRA